VRYAAYGSNLHPTRLLQRAAGASLLGAAAVGGRALRFHKRSVDGSGKCNLIESDGEIHLAVYELEPRDRDHLDWVEGVGAGYEIAEIDLPAYGRCFLYSAADSHIDESLKPYSWYKELVLVGAEYLGFPKPYIEAIAAVETLVDPDPVRHSENMRIVEKALAVGTAQPLES
jgi:hypothetical protein